MKSRGDDAELEKRCEACDWDMPRRDLAAFDSFDGPWKNDDRLPEPVVICGRPT